MIACKVCLLALPVPLQCPPPGAQRRPGVWVTYRPCVFQANRSSWLRRSRRFLLTWAGRLLRQPGWLLGVLLLAASHPARPATAKPSLSVQVMFQGLYCGRKRTRVQWLDDRLAVARALGRVRHNRTHISRMLRQFDFTHQAMVMIRMGAPPAANSAFALAQTSASVIDNALRIRVRWGQPLPGAHGARPVISPCLLTAVPRGGYMAVRVVDAGGVVVGRVKVPGATPARDSGAAGSATEHTATELRHRQ